MPLESHDDNTSNGYGRVHAFNNVHILSECSRRWFERKPDNIVSSQNSKSNVLLNEAIAIAANGIPVFPVNIKKQPLTKRGFHDASTDAVTIERMFCKSAVAGIAIPTGPSSGLVVIDRDRKNGVDGIATCVELEAQLGVLPETLHQRTGSGGDQLFFQYPEGVEIRCSAGKLGPGLDVRGLGGYAVIAPSVNTSGAYEWLNMLCPAPLPEVWVRKMAVNMVEAGLSAREYAPKIVATMSTQYGRAALVSECRLLAQAPQGTRHDQLFKSVAAIASLVAGGEIVESEARVAIAAAIQSWNTGAESEPKTLKTIEDAWSRGMSASRQATRNSYLLNEKSSGRSGESGRASERGENVDPNVSDPKSGLVDSSRVILPEGYALNADGVWFIAKSADPDEPDEKIWIGPRLQFLAWTRNVSSEEWGLMLSWEDPDRRRHEYVLPYSLLTDSRQAWRAELSSRGWLGATNAKAKSMLVQLFTSVRVQGRARCVDRTGWHGWVYVLPDTVIGCDEERLVLQTLMAANPFTTSGTLEEWNTTIGSWARGNRLLMFAICVALSGPLLKFVGLDSGGIHLFGKSSAGKTTVMLVAISVFCAPFGVRTWRSTANALEAICALHNDALLCLDEIGQAPSRVVGEAIYMLANGQGKGRAKIDGSARNLRSWRCSILSNGELPLAEKLREDGQKIRAGQEVRIVDLLADAGEGLGVWQNLHQHDNAGRFSENLKSASAKNYGTLGRSFIAALIEHRDNADIEAKLNAVVAEWTPVKSTGQVRRVVARFALAGVAGELAVAFGLVPWAEGEPLCAAKECLDSWLQSRGGSGDREDDYVIDTMKSFLGRYSSARFQNMDPGPHDRIIDRAGFRRSLNGQNQYLFTAEQLRAVYSGSNHVSAAKALNRAGMLHRNDGNNLTIWVNLPDLGRTRVYAVVLSNAQADSGLSFVDSRAA